MLWQVTNSLCKDDFNHKDPAGSCIRKSRGQATRSWLPQGSGAWQDPLCALPCLGFISCLVTR